jgi:hypothetical protein
MLIQGFIRELASKCLFQKFMLKYLKEETWVESKEGKATIFYFTIPYKPVLEKTPDVDILNLPGLTINQ